MSFGYRVINRLVVQSLYRDGFLYKIIALIISDSSVVMVSAIAENPRKSVKKQTNGFVVNPTFCYSSYITRTHDLNDYNFIGSMDLQFDRNTGYPLL